MRTVWRRRRTLWLGMLTAARIDGRRRAETLTIDEWGRIAAELERQAEHVGGNDA